MTWLTVPQLTGLPGMPTSVPRCREFLQRSSITSRTRSGRGGGLEYLSTELPQGVQQALAAQAVARMKPIAAAIEAGAAASQAEQTQACASAMARYGQQLERSGGFDPAQNPRLDLFQRFESYHRARGGAVWPAITEFCALWARGEIEALAGTLAAYPQLPAKTLDKWFRAWRINGVEALLERKPRKDKGQGLLSQDKDLHDVFVAVMSEMLEPTARQMGRVMTVELGKIDKAHLVPAERTLRAWMQEYRSGNKVALLKLKNPDGWRNKYMPAFGSRSEHILHVNQEWQLDSTIADAQQRTEIAFGLHDGETGEIRRHALVAVIDVFTRRAQVLVSRTSSANAVKAVTRRAMLAWGKPQRVKTDNGKDYTAIDFDFGLQALKIEHALCTPFSPDQKPFIERFLGTLLHDLFPMLQGFVGRDITQRKAIESAKSFAQRFGDGAVELRMTPEQLQGVINGWLDEYHGRVHSELGCSPDEMAARNTTHTVQVPERALDLFMMSVAGNGSRTVLKRGISLGNAWFAAPELAAVMGEQVYCRQDEADLGTLHVFAVDGTYICQAVDHTRLGIGRAELAAKARHIERTTITPQVNAMRKAGRAGLADKAVAAIYSERQDAAVDQASNVTRIAPRVVEEVTPAVQSFLASTDDSATLTKREAARAAFAEQAEAAPVHRLDTPRQRYSAWVRLSARHQAGEQLGQRDVEWLRHYEGSNEFDAWDAMQGGADPLAEAG
ncbi:DDE-type integrase/transposase/recombinase [Variovorax sp. VNK109]|uniref:DDE-type integrase/transposase/recombinase n=1 Tax=Variovorax sp. VNK109 TaxID=3400919 RepID=UPI003C01D4A8